MLATATTIKRTPLQVWPGNRANEVNPFAGNNCFLKRFQWFRIFSFFHSSSCHLLSKEDFFSGTTINGEILSGWIEKKELIGYDVTCLPQGQEDYLCPIVKLNIIKKTNLINPCEIIIRFETLATHQLIICRMKLAILSFSKKVDAKSDTE